MADHISESMVEAVARAIEPETFEKPRINLYGDLYERAFARARRAIEAVAALSAAPASAQMEELSRLREVERRAVELVQRWVSWCDDWHPGKSHPSDDIEAARAFLRESLPTAGSETK